MTIAFNLYVFELNSSINMKAIVANFNIIIVTSFTFSHFYLSELLTNYLLSIADNFYNSSWYQVLAIKHQKLIILAIDQAHQEFRLKGLGIFDCSLVVFTTV